MKSTTRFPTSHRWTVYVTPKSPKPHWHCLFMIFAVFDSSPLTVCINCSFFTFIKCIGPSFIGTWTGAMQARWHTRGYSWWAAALRWVTTMTWGWTHCWCSWPLPPVHSSSSSSLLRSAAASKYAGGRLAAELSSLHVSQSETVMFRAIRPETDLWFLMLWARFSDCAPTFFVMHICVIFAFPSPLWCPLPWCPGSCPSRLYPSIRHWIRRSLSIPVTSVTRLLTFSTTCFANSMLLVSTFDKISADMIVRCTVAELFCFGMGKARRFKVSVLSDTEAYWCLRDGLLPKCSGSCDLLKFWEISDNISETVQHSDIVEMED